VEPETDKRDYVNMRCAGCGWLGTVSKFHRTCPKCGNQITPTTTMPSV
jgi:rRNA maturation endonuclease Nob1